MNNLPLFYYPSTWLLVDDDKSFLNNTAQSFRERNQVNISTFESSTDCHTFLKNYNPPLSQQPFLRSKTEDDSYGALRYAPVEFDVTTIANLADVPARHDEITAIILDYDMPDLDGTSLAEAIRHIPAHKLLLTGKNKVSEAITAFNKNIIHCFIEKESKDMAKALQHNLEMLTLQYFQTKTAPLLTHLETDSPTPLTDPAFISFFQAHCQQHQIEEYYLIDKQGSFLCIDKNKNRSCLVVHTDESLDDWYQLHTDNDEPTSSAQLDSVQRRKQIPFFGVGKESWEVESTELENFLYPAQVLMGRKKYFWTHVFPL